jgi:hypothetical protein
VAFQMSGPVPSPSINGTVMIIGVLILANTKRIWIQGLKEKNRVYLMS